MSDFSHIHAGNFTGSFGFNIIDRPGIAIVRSGSNTAFFGFTSIDEAIEYKAEKGFGQDWPIRDKRRGEHDPWGQPFACNPADALLRIGSLLRDHLAPFLGYHAIRTADLELSRRIATFAVDAIGQAAATSGQDVGEIDVVDGDVTDDAGSVVAHAWIASSGGVFLDLAPRSRKLIAAYLSSDEPGYITKNHNPSNVDRSDPGWYGERCDVTQRGAPGEISDRYRNLIARIRIILISESPFPVMVHHEVCEP